MADDQDEIVVKKQVGQKQGIHKAEYPENQKSRIEKN